MNIDKDKVERETRAQLNNRHKQELRKLEQSNTQTIKSASKKGGKSAKLAATADAEEKIKELNTKHEKEIELWESLHSDGGDKQKAKSESASTQNQETNVTTSPAAPAVDTDESEKTQQPKQKLSKAQKRRLAKEAAEAERLKRIADFKANTVSERDVEHGILRPQLAKQKLAIYEVPADGHCLYNAIADQIKTRNLSLNEVDNLSDVDAQFMRNTASKYMLQHPDDFAPFVILDEPQTDVDDQDDNDDAEKDIDLTNVPEQLIVYCRRLRRTADWGGQLELRALASALQCSIVVHAANDAPLRMGDNDDDERVLDVAYHKKEYALGEHYNSCRRV